MDTSPTPGSTGAEATGPPETPAAESASTETPETVAEEIVTVEIATEEIVTEEIVTEETVTEETVTDETVTEETVTDETVTDETPAAETASSQESETDSLGSTLGSGSSDADTAISNPNQADASSTSPTVKFDATTGLVVESAHASGHLFLRSISDLNRIFIKSAYKYIPESSSQDKSRSWSKLSHEGFNVMWLVMDQSLNTRLLFYVNEEQAALSLTNKEGELLLNARGGLLYFFYRLDIYSASEQLIGFADGRTMTNATSDELFNVVRSDSNDDPNPFTVITMCDAKTDKAFCQIKEESGTAEIVFLHPCKVTQKLMFMIYGLKSALSAYNLHSEVIHTVSELPEDSKDSMDELLKFITQKITIKPALRETREKVYYNLVDMRHQVILIFVCKTASLNEINYDVMNGHSRVLFKVIENWTEQDAFRVYDSETNELIGWFKERKIYGTEIDRPILSTVSYPQGPIRFLDPTDESKAELRPGETDCTLGMSPSLPPTHKALVLAYVARYVHAVMHLFLQVKVPVCAEYEDLYKLYKKFDWKLMNNRLE